MNKGDETSHTASTKYGRQTVGSPEGLKRRAKKEGMEEEGGRTLRPKCKKVRGFFWVSGEGKTWEKYGEIGRGEKRRGERETPDIAFSSSMLGH